MTHYERRSMIRQLQEGGAVVVVPTEALRFEVRSMIASLRGQDFRDEVNVLVVDSPARAALLSQAVVPVFFDPAFMEASVHPSIWRVLNCSRAVPVGASALPLGEDQ